MIPRTILLALKIILRYKNVRLEVVRVWIEFDMLLRTTSCWLTPRSRSGWVRSLSSIFNLKVNICVHILKRANYRDRIKFDGVCFSLSKYRLLDGSAKAKLNTDEVPAKSTTDPVPIFLQSSSSRCLNFFILLAPIVLRLSRFALYFRSLRFLANKS